MLTAYKHSLRCFLRKRKHIIVLFIFKFNEDNALNVKFFFLNNNLTILKKISRDIW